MILNMKFKTIKIKEIIKNEITSWNTFEIIWLSVFSLTAFILSVLWKYNVFNFFVFLSGVLCVVLTAKGKLYSYIAGIFNTLGYAYISYSNGLFGEMGLNLFFFLPTSIIGFCLWKRNIKQEHKLVMRKLNLRHLLIVGLISGVLIYCMGFLLSLIKTQNTPYIDATTNILSITATILTMKRFREQWIFYIALNIFTVIMWTMRSINGSEDGILMTVMWSAYLINAVYGYYNWSKGVKLEINIHKGIK